MGLKTLESMPADEFRAWCKSVGTRFEFDHDSNTWFITMSDDDLQGFAMDVIEKYGESDE